MKHGIRITCLFLYFCLSCVKVNGAQEFFPFLAEVTVKRVNVRAGQSANFETLCQLDKGDEAVVLSKSYSWYKIELPKIAKSYVSVEFVRQLDKRRGEIIGKRVNVRGGASVHFTVLGQLNVGAKVNIIEKRDGWYRIEPILGSVGWISDEFLAFKSKSLKSYSPKLVSVNTETKKKKNTQRIEAEKKPLVKDQPVTKNTISLTGYLEPQKNLQSKLISYQLVVRGQPAYYIEGLNRILDDFLYYKVTVQGTIKKDLQNQYSYPVVVVTEIQLLL